MIGINESEQLQNKPKKNNLPQQRECIIEQAVKSTEKAPKFSIISVVRNNEIGIRATLESIISQTVSDYEVIVIDGQSTDQTPKVLYDYSPFIDQLVSEPDDGVYHAMMKGVGLARGAWVIFMNSGDIFASPHVLEAFRPSDDADLAYGDARFRTNTNPKGQLINAKPLEEIWKGIVFSHQSLFCRREVLRELGFNLNYSIVADYDFCVRAYKQGFTFQDLNYCVASIEPGGISEDFYRRTAERFPIALKAFPTQPVIQHFSRLVWNDIRVRSKHLRNSIFSKLVFIFSSIRGTK